MDIEKNLLAKPAWITKAKKAALPIIAIMVLGVVVLLVVELTWSPVAFPDAGLKRAIRADLSWPPRLTNLTRLGAYRMDITDLTGIEYCVNLTDLRLGENRISDISPLAGLTNLESLMFWDNNISDISPLAGLTNLRGLHLSINNISDISALAGLTNLSSLDLKYNNISDISPLVDNSGLSEGATVYLSDNPLSTTSIDVYIPRLEARGVTVIY